MGPPCGWRSKNISMVQFYNAAIPLRHNQCIGLFMLDQFVLAKDIGSVCQILLTFRNPNRLIQYIMLHFILWNKMFLCGNFDTQSFILAK